MNDCVELQKLGLWNVYDCCNSCHGDEEGYLCEIYINGEVYIVCCAASSILRERGIAE